MRRQLDFTSTTSYAQEALFPTAGHVSSLSLNRYPPLNIPDSSTLRQCIGGTPLLEIEDDVYAKLEGVNLSGSIKDRAILRMILAMFEEGHLKDGSSLGLITSGSAGVSLLALQRAIAEDCGVKLKIMLMMPKAYEAKAARIIAAGVPVTHDQPDDELDRQLVLLDGTFAEVVTTGKSLAAEKGIALLDQHFDINGMLAHQSTAMEIMAQVPDVTDVVCATGSGATAAGLRTFLHPDVDVHARPSLSGTIDGLGDITKYNNFCQPSTLAGYGTLGMFDPDCAREHQAELLNEFGVECGPSSGATMWLAREIKRERADAKVVFISADGKLG